MDRQEEILRMKMANTKAWAIFACILLAEVWGFFFIGSFFFIQDDRMLHWFHIPYIFTAIGAIVVTIFQGETIHDYFEAKLINKINR